MILLIKIWNPNKLVGNLNSEKSKKKKDKNRESRESRDSRDSKDGLDNNHNHKTEINLRKQFSTDTTDTKNSDQSTILGNYSNDDNAHENNGNYHKNYNENKENNDNGNDNDNDENDDTQIDMNLNYVKNDMIVHNGEWKPYSDPDTGAVFW